MTNKIVRMSKASPFFEKSYGICIAAFATKEFVRELNVQKIVKEINSYLLLMQTESSFAIAPNPHTTIAMALRDPDNVGQPFHNSEVEKAVSSIQKLKANNTQHTAVLEGMILRYAHDKGIHRLSITAKSPAVVA